MSRLNPRGKLQLLLWNHEKTHIGEMAEANMIFPGHGPRIVLGLDYGTTYTGLAWIQTDGQDDPSVDSLNVFRDWPGMEGRMVAQKVPSAYSYSTCSNINCKQWGYSISDDSRVLRWTKLELETRTTIRELEVLQELVKGLDLINELRASEDAASTNDVPRQISKDSSDLVMDYLYEIAREWFGHMTRDGRYTLESVPLEIVVTHPASWSYEAINKTFRAVSGAFPKGMFPTLQGISLTSEPEACALYIVQDMLKKEINTLIPGECFILCDAGGGTVDVVSYLTESIEPLKLTMVGRVSGGKYGATFIDHAFLDWLRPRLKNQDLLPKDFLTGGHFVLTPVVRTLLKRFEKVKHAFNGTLSGDISLPRGSLVAESEGGSLGSGVISLTPTEISSMFEKSVRGTVNLIARQVVQVETAVDRESPRRVTNVFLAGGFSENEYLYKEVKKYTDSTGHIHLQRAEDCWSGVAKGAALRGMSINMDAVAKVTPCPRHYGICVSMIYADWRHSSEQAITDLFHGEKVVPNEILWFARKGDVILPGKPVSSTLEVECRFESRNLKWEKKQKISFVATDVDNPPSCLSDLPKAQNEIAHLEVDSTLIPNTALQQRNGPRRNGLGRNNLIGRSTYYVATISVKFRIDYGVEVTLECCGKQVGFYNTNL